MGNATQRPLDVETGQAGLSFDLRRNGDGQRLGVCVRAASAGVISTSSTASTGTAHAA
jgi:hypothetical protein